MINGQAEIFEAFRNNLIFKITPYLQKYGFNTNDVKEGHNGIGAEYVGRRAVISLGFSFHHLDYGDGIIVSLKSEFGDKILRNEVLKKSNKDVPVYFFGLNVIDSEFDRILNDMKIHFDKYLKISEENIEE